MLWMQLSMQILNQNPWMDADSKIEDPHISVETQSQLEQLKVTAAVVAFTPTLLSVSGL